MTKPVTAFTTFGANTTGTTTQLDNNFLTLKAAVNDFNTYSNYLVDTGAADAYVVTLGANLTGTLAAGLMLQFKATNANTGASTLVFNGAAAKNILTVGGAALTAGMIPANGIIEVIYDGTQFLLLSAAPGNITLATKQATTSGTAINFTGIPSGVKRITVEFVGVSTNGSSNLIIQIGPSGGIEATGYLGAAISLPNASAIAAVNPTTGFGVTGAIGGGTTLHGSVVLNLVDASTNTWVSQGFVGHSDAAQGSVSGGSKSAAGTIDRVRITAVNGTDAFDAGAINISYER